MAPRIALDRVHDRQSLRLTLDRLERKADQSGMMLKKEERDDSRIAWISLISRMKRRMEN